MNRPAIRTLLLVLLLSATAAWAQNEPIFGSTSQVADLNDPFVFGLNPALGEMTRPQVAVGFQVLHLGLLANSTDLNTGGLVYTTRKFGGGLTLDADYLSTPLWGLKRFRVGYGRRFLAGLSLGFSMGLDQRSFDLISVDLSQGSYLDPLLTGDLNRTVPTTSLAAAYSLPLEGVTAGLVLENPHEPNVSLGGNQDGVFLPSTLRAGLSWERELFMVNAGLVDQQWRRTYAASLRGNIYGEHSLLARVETDQWSLGARMGLGQRSWLEYTYTEPRSDLAGLSSGTHAIVLCWHASGRAKPAVRYSHRMLDEGPYDPQLGASDSDFFPAAETVAVALLEPAHDFFNVAAETDTALIRVKRLQRVFGPRVDMARVRRLPRWRIGVLDSTWSGRVTWDITEGMTDAYPENDLPRGNYSATYRADMDSLGRKLRAGRGGDLVIVADQDQLDRARYLARKVGADSLTAGRVRIKQLRAIADAKLRHRLLQPVGPDSIPALEEITLYQYPAIPIHLVPLGAPHEIQAWTVDILDSLARPVRQIKGRGTPPARVIWDWKDQNGRLVDVDQYTYQLRWRDGQGRSHHTIAREILIARQVMQRTLEFGMEKKPLREMERGQPMLILDPGREGLSVGKNKLGNEKPENQPTEGEE